MRSVKPDPEVTPESPSSVSCPGIWRPAVAGLLTTTLALGFAELVAGLEKGTASPIVVVGGEVIDAVPPPVKDFAIATFGTNDKVALVVGIVVLLAIFGVILGVLAARRLIVGGAGVALFGSVGAAAALSRPNPEAFDALPSIIGAAAGMVALTAFVAALTGRSFRHTASTPKERTTGALDRRRFLTMGMAVTAFAAGAGSVGRFLTQSFSAAASRAAVVLPAPTKALPAIPTGVDLDIEGLSPFTTPNIAFYRIDTALVVPQIPAEDWSLRIHGMVDNELELTYDDLLSRPMIETDITMTCVSNEVGGKLVGNARWLGVRLADLLEEAGVQDGATQIVGRSFDGWNNGFPTENALDGRDAIVAVGMNGAPLPIEHGFPARIVVPGLYGYVSATKWVTELELTRLEDFDGYWVKRTWAKEAPIKTQSRIDTPKGLAKVPPGKTAVAGVAWAQLRGIAKVEVRVDDGEWVEARLADEVNVTTWRQWVHEWDATPGRHTITVRATDTEGELQPEERMAPIPEGAAGWHNVVVLVEDA